MKNSKFLKTIVATLALTFAINIATPQKANAGIVLYAIGKNNTEMTDDARHAFQVFGIVFFIVGLWSGWQYIVLDADTSVNKNQIDQLLQNKYTALATQPAISSELATEIALEGNKAFETNKGAERVEVKLSAEKVAKILRKAIRNSDNAESLNKLASDLTL